MRNLSRFQSYQNSKRIRFNFKKSNTIDTNEIYITEEKYNELYSESFNLEPFLDTPTRKFVKVKNKFSSIKIGFKSHPYEESPFVDRNSFSSEIIINNHNLPDSVYPFSFNYDNFFTRTNRVDVFGNIKKIQMSEDHIDKLKGFRGDMLGKSSDAFGNNLNIQSHYSKFDPVVYHYEDNINPSFIFNELDEIVVSKINQNVNPINGVIINTVTYVKKNIKSPEVRYFAYEEKHIGPFIDKSYNENQKSLENKFNRYVFTDEVINNTILENRDINKAVEESILYSPRGKNYDYSLSSGTSSFLFSESID